MGKKSSIESNIEKAISKKFTGPFALTSLENIDLKDVQFDFDKCETIIVDDQKKLDLAYNDIQQSDIISVDLENYNQGIKSYEGFLCLMQITIVSKESNILKTYVVDLIELKDQIYDTLGKNVFENPEILKVMHSSASNDIGWLQRDFGVMIANVFDIQFIHGKTTL